MPELAFLNQSSTLPARGEPNDATTLTGLPLHNWMNLAICGTPARHHTEDFCALELVAIYGGLSKEQRASAGGEVP